MKKLALVGLGHQGRLHISCIKKAEHHKDVSIKVLVDPKKDNRQEAGDLLKKCFNRAAPRTYDSVDKWLKSISNRAGDWIVDICTPPAQHLAVFEKACKAGVRRFIIEKPLADTLEAAQRIEKLAVENDCFVALQENYIFSPITRILKEKLQTIKPNLAVINFSKDRRLDFFEGRGKFGAANLHNFDVEIPHQIAIALFLFGTECVLETADTGNLTFREKQFIDADHGIIHAVHQNSTSTTTVMLRSCFSQRNRERHVDIDGIDSEGKKLKLIGYYALGSGELLGGYRVTYPTEGGAREHRDDISDDNLTSSLNAALEALTQNRHPEIGPEFGCRIIKLIQEAKQKATPV